MKQRTLHDPFESQLREAREQVRANQIADAEQTFRDILRKSPAHPAASFGLGMLLHHAGADEAAVEYLQAAVKAWPKHLEARFSLAVSLYRLQQLEDSTGHFETIIRRHPHVAEAHNYLGIVKAQLCLSREAEQHFLRALKLRPSFAEAHKNLGTHYGEQGRLDEARRHLKKAIACRPYYAQAYWQFATINKFSDYDDDIRAMESSYDRESTNDDERMRLAYALGKAFHDLRQYSRAFEYWLEGNRLRFKLSRYDVGPVLAEMAAMKRVFPGAVRTSVNRTRATVPALFFIVGMPRSGTSLVEQILASHSSVYGAGELDALDVAIRGAVSRFPADLGKLNSADWECVREHYLKEVSRHVGSESFVTDKMPSNFLHIGAISVLFPDAKVIHCRRDAMDTGLSCFRNHFVSDKLGFTCDLSDLGKYYRQYLDLMAHWNRVQTADIYDIHYESLVMDPEREVQRLLEFCELPFEEGCLAFHENKRSVKTASAAQVRQPIYRSSLQGWKAYERELQPLKMVLEQRPGRLAFYVSDIVSRFRR